MANRVKDEFDKNCHQKEIQRSSSGDENDTDIDDQNEGIINPQKPIFCHSQAQSQAWKALLSVCRRRPPQTGPFQTQGSQARPGASKPARDFTFGIQERRQA